MDDQLILQGGSQRLTTDQIVTLRVALNSRKEHLQKIEALGGPPFDGDLLVIADKDVTCGELYQILEAAAHVGFAHFKLVTNVW